MRRRHPDDRRRSRSVRRSVRREPDDRPASGSCIRRCETGVLDLQGAAGNAAVNRMLGRAGRPRSEVDIHPPSPAPVDDEPEPDWQVPVEGDPDERREGVRRRGGVPASRYEAGVSTVRREGGGGLRRVGSEGTPRRAGGASPGTIRHQASATRKRAFPSFASIKANLAVRKDAWQAWVTTLKLTSKTSRREQGFWIQWDRSTSNGADGRFRTVGHTVGAASRPDVTVSMNLGSKPSDAGDWYTVGSFHTHTPTYYRKVARAVGPSAADHAADAGDNVAGLVYDYRAARAGLIPAGHPLWSFAVIYHSGPTRRS